MRPLEIAFLVITFGFLVAHTLRGLERKNLFALAAAGLATFLLGALLGHARWQVAPAYLLFFILSVLLLKRSSAHGALRSLGAVLGVALLAVAATASLGMPILTLPAPDGPHVVGSASLSLLDETRDNAFFDRPGEARELYVQLWYPGAFTDGESRPRKRTLWEELHRGDLDRFTVFSSYLRGIETHSYADLPLSPAEPAYPLIVFSHAMGSFAEQSTLLMENLASHGYVVLALGHPYASMRVVAADGRAVYLDLDKIEEASAPYDAESAALTAQLERAGSREERMRLHLERYERAGKLNDLTAIWVDDLRFVLDSLTTSPNRDAKLQAIAARIDVARVGFLGMSFGGGAVTELCKSDTRCLAAVNIDGGTFGERQRQPLEVPYLALVREGQDTLDYLLPASRSDYYAIEVAGTTHLDFTDDTVVLPILRWARITGPIGGERAIELTNVVSRRFFDAYLRGGPKPRFDEGFPELTVETNDLGGD